MSIIDVDVSDLYEKVSQGRLRELLVELPFVILNAKELYRDRQDSVFSIKRNVDILKSAVELTVASEKDAETGKLKYYNDMLRKNEVEKRLNMNEGYIKCTADLREAEAQEFLARSRLEYVEDLFKSVRLLARLRIADMENTE